MSGVPDGPAVAREDVRGLAALAAASLVAGAWSGLVVAAFRRVLAMADRFRDRWLGHAHTHTALGFVLVVGGCAAAVSLSAWLVRRFSRYASGSGVPQVELALARELPLAPLPRIILVKFVGGIVAIGSGLALGPQGPSVQMGAVGARIIGGVFRRPWEDLRALIAAGAGAGLAVAFNAPIAGAIFVLEELERRFEPRTAIAALGASSAAILVSRVLLGDAPQLHLAVSARAAAATGPFPYASAAAWPLHVALGAIAGAVAALYNRAILAGARWAERPGPLPTWTYPPAIGALVGVVGWLGPGWIGGGEDITQRLLLGSIAVGIVPAFFLVRFLLGAASHAAFTPGGLFAPMLLLGAQLGFAVGVLARAAFPGLGIDVQAFAVVGMAAFFTGVVRSPVTGIVLVIEMTAAFTSLLPMLAACFAAMLVARALGSPPIYDSLKARVERSLSPH